MRNVVQIEEKRAEQRSTVEGRIGRLEEEVEQLHLRDNKQLKQIGDVAKQRTTPEQARRIAERSYLKECARLEKLRDDCIKVLVLLKKKGVVTQEELNQVL